MVKHLASKQILVNYKLIAYTFCIKILASDDHTPLSAPFGTTPIGPWPTAPSSTWRPPPTQSTTTPWWPWIQTTTSTTGTRKTTTDPSSTWRPPPTQPTTTPWWWWTPWIQTTTSTTVTRKTTTPAKTVFPTRSQTRTTPLYPPTRPHSGIRLSLGRHRRQSYPFDPTTGWPPVFPLYTLGSPVRSFCRNGNGMYSKICICPLSHARLVCSQPNVKQH